MINKTVEFVQNPWYNLFIGNFLSQEIILMKKTGIISLAAAALFCTYFGFSSHVKAQEKAETFSASCTQTALAPAADENQKFPEKFDLREKGLVSAVKSQGNFGTCWSFAASGALETSLIKNSPFIDLSELHLAYFSFFGDNTPSNPETGANSFIAGGHMGYAAASYARWTGPVDESLLPYDTTEENIDTSLSDRSDYFVSDINMINPYTLKDSSPDEVKRFSDSEIKQMLMEENAVAVNIRYESTCSEKTFAQYDPTNGKTNHAVLIVGWDDSYSRDNFLVNPPGDGAWIAKNSWGDSWGLDGYFYISYYDNSLSDACSMKTEPKLYDKNYQHDTLFYTAAISPDNAERCTGYMANIFTAEENEFIRGAGFYTTDNNTEYEITVYTGLTNPNDPTSGKEAAVIKGKEKYAGYHTAALAESVPVKEGEMFSVTARLTNPEFFCAVPVEAAVVLMENRFAVNVSEITPEEIELNSEKGESFISSNGTRWTDTKGLEIEAVYDNPQIPDSNIMYYIGNVCLKAFTSVQIKNPPEYEVNRSVLSSLTINKMPLKINDGQGSPVTELCAEISDVRDYAVLFPSGTGTITVNGTEVVSGHQSHRIPVEYGENNIEIVSSEPGLEKTVYRLKIYRKRAAADYRNETIIFDEENASVKAEDGHIFKNGESISDYFGQTLTVTEKDKEYELVLNERRDLGKALGEHALLTDSEAIAGLFSFKDEVMFSTSPDMSDAQSVYSRIVPTLFGSFFRIYPDYDTDLYFQIPATDTAPESTVCHFSIPSRPVISDEDVQVEITGSTSFELTVNNPENRKAEYRTLLKYSNDKPGSSDMYPSEKITDNKAVVTDLIPGKIYSVYIKYNASDTGFCTDIKEVVVKMPGGNEKYSFSYEKEKIIFDEEKYKVYDPDGNEMHCYDSVSEFTGRELKMTDADGSVTVISVPSRAKAPEVTIDYQNGVLTGIFDSSISYCKTDLYGYTSKPASSANLADKKGIISFKKIFSSYCSSGETLSFFYTHTDNSFASERCSVVIPHQDNISAKLLNIRGYTDSTITLEKHEGLEYGIRKKFSEEFTWQDEPVFTGLSRNTQYILAVRYKASENTLCSKATCSIIKTLPSEYLPGDLNDDGNLSASDILIFRRILLYGIRPDAYQRRSADMNNDGRINVLDFQRMLYKITE